MKKVYFVRHGQSEMNVGQIRLNPNTSLTEKGREQSEILAERCLDFPVNIIVSSTMNRAKETAEIINKKISKSIKYSDLFSERKRPSSFYGKAKNDPSSIETQKKIMESFHNLDYHFSDEENFLDLKERVGKALDYLSALPEENILVVTHGYLLSIIVAYAIFGKNLNSEECLKCIDAFNIENSGITVLCYDKDKENKSPWWLWVWNDHSHLG